MGSGISDVAGSVSSLKDMFGGAADGLPMPGGPSSDVMGALAPGGMSGGSNALAQFGKKALKNGLAGGAQGLQQQQNQQRGGGMMPQYINGSMLPQIPGQSQQQVVPYGVNNPFFGG